MRLDFNYINAIHKIAYGSFFSRSEKRNHIKWIKETFDLQLNQIQSDVRRMQDTHHKEIFNKNRGF